MSRFARTQPVGVVPCNSKSTFSELKKVDPRTQQIFTQILEEDNSQNLSRYENWRRIKVESIDTKSMSTHLKSKREHFVDPDFPHDNSVICRGQHHERVKWTRVKRLVEDAVYSKEQNSQYIEGIKLNRPALEKALTLIARTAPDLYKELVSKVLNAEGIYEYKIFNKGFIENVVIDDYLPVTDGIAMFVGPVRNNEVYPMLIEKALAKAAGSYENIPEKTEDILEMIFCGPVSTNFVRDLREKDSLGDKMQTALEQKQLTVLVSKKDPKIRNFGLNDGEVYLVIKHHEMQWAGRQLKELKESKVSFLNQSQIFNHSHISDMRSMKSRKGQENSLSYSRTEKNNAASSMWHEEKRQVEHVYECISESKLSAWNGRYALNDEVWNKVDLQKKMFLYSQLKQNRSFLINEADIARLFEEVLIFETHKSNNRDWIAHDSHNDKPSFSKFQVMNNDHVCLRATTPVKMRQTIILARETGYKQYTFIASNFVSYSHSVEVSVPVYPGNYVVAVYHSWQMGISGHYHLFLASNEHTSLQRGGLTDNDFLTKALTSLEETRPKSEKENKEECLFRMQLQRLGLAYMVLKPSNSKKKKVTMKINQDRLAKEQWDLLQPYDGLEEVTASQQQNKYDTYLILSKPNIDAQKRYYFPLSAFLKK